MHINISVSSHLWSIQYFSVLWTSTYLTIWPVHTDVCCQALVCMQQASYMFRFACDSFLLAACLYLYTPVNVFPAVWSQSLAQYATHLLIFAYSYILIDNRCNFQVIIYEYFHDFKEFVLKMYLLTALNMSAFLSSSFKNDKRTRKIFVLFF